MEWLVGYFVVAAFSAVVLGYMCKKAKFGWEDEDGFHYGDGECEPNRTKKVEAGE